MNRHACALKLVIDVDDAVLHIQIADGQSTELGNSHSGVEQNKNHLIVLAVDIVVMYELQEFSHLVRFDCLASNAVIYYYAGELKSERILQDHHTEPHKSTEKYAAKVLRQRCDLKNLSRTALSSWFGCCSQTEQNRRKQCAQFVK